MVHSRVDALMVDTMMAEQPYVTSETGHTVKPGVLQAGVTITQV